MFSRRAKLALSLVAVCQFALLLGLSWARYANVHQRTFDLALYARIAWGLAHGDLWAPVINAPALGCHIAPVLLPLGLLGRVLGVVPVLLFAQALAIALTVFPIARIGARRLGTRGLWLGVAAFVLYPNLFHVGTYEFHPGTLAVLPMAWAFDALDRGRLDALAYSALGVLVCREDLGAFCVIIAILHARKYGERRAWYLAGAALLYTLGALAVVNHFAPAHGSLSQHYAQWGGSPLGVIAVLFRDPARVVAHLRARIMYLPQVLAPLSFFSLRAPQLLLPGLPYLVLNLLSAFPTAQQQYSHYLTPAVPALIISGIVGVTEVRKLFLQRLWYATLVLGHVALGGSPLSRDFDRSAFRADDATASARRVLALVPDGASVQAPAPLLPHLAERHDVRLAPPPEAGSTFTVLDVSHRQRYAHQEVLLRTSEEPLIRAWLARVDQTLLSYEPPYALFRRGSGSAPCSVAAEGATTALSACLSFVRAELRDETLTLDVRANASCPADLALRFGPDAMPARVELLCGGALSPARLLAGQQLRFSYAVTAREAAALRARGLWVGALRASGAPVQAGDPPAVRVTLEAR